MFSQTQFNMKKKKENHFHYCEKASLIHQSCCHTGFFSEAEEKIKYIAAGI